MSNSIKFSRPLITDKVSNLISKVKDTVAEYQYIEVWLDYLSDIDVASFDRILEASDKEFIILTRRQNLEEPKLSKSKRFELLEHAIKKNLLIDCDLRQKDELELLASKNYNKLLLSYHSYKDTPKDLNSIYKEMNGFKPLIYKFACYCNSLNDSLDLLKLGLMLKSNNNKCIVTGMGENGKLVRLASASWFNEFNFAPISARENTATGQLTINQLTEAIKILEMEIK